MLFSSIVALFMPDKVHNFCLSGYNSVAELFNNQLSVLQIELSLIQLLRKLQRKLNLNNGIMCFSPHQKLFFCLILGAVYIVFVSLITYSVIMNP